MNKITMVFAFLLVMTAGMVKAQNTPVVDEREQNQRTRIRSGVASGEVTRNEAARLRAEQRQVHRTERRAKSDGTVTPREQRKLKHEQNRAGRDIRKQKHDRQQRPAAN